MCRMYRVSLQLFHTSAFLFTCKFVVYLDVYKLLELVYFREISLHSLFYLFLKVFVEIINCCQLVLYLCIYLLYCLV
jgi:hypothetical protein